MSNGMNISKNTVKRIRQSDLQLHSTIHKIDSSLSESLHQIEYSVRKIAQEQGQMDGEYQPYYLRRRRSIEQIVESEKAFPFSNELRERASSLGSRPTTNNKLQIPSNTASKESVSSEDGNGTRDVSSPRRRPKTSENTEENPVSNLTQFYRFRQGIGSRRNSLPMSFSLQNLNDLRARNQNNAGDDGGLNVRLHRLEHELAHRKPKSRRQLLANSMTSIDERKEIEKLEMERRRHEAEEYVSSIEKCNSYYIRNNKSNQAELTMDEIFQKS
ncbi:uncharacterized protein LOC133190399 [Saccostrea echinata]|uniref:uncharacterized protein LOC133190399 n=1 Tax=Saccostrea echinata TaxID=191078 RepID=UPI002A7F06F6|nr:uncharacterized protein LOC133190399 [Saccostrea echinata]